jgi:hypothetical protein
LTINPAKSVLIPIAIYLHLLMKSCKILWVAQSNNLSTKYLGLSLSVKKPTKIDFLLLLLKVQKRFQGSTGRLLSKGGRLILVIAVINALP